VNKHGQLVSSSLVFWDIDPSQLSLAKPKLML